MKKINLFCLIAITLLSFSNLFAQTHQLCRKELSVFYNGMYSLGEAWGRAGAFGSMTMDAVAILQIQVSIQTAADGLNLIGCVGTRDIENLKNLRNRIPSLSAANAATEIGEAIRKLQLIFTTINTASPSLVNLYVTGIHVGAAQAWASSVQCRAVPMPASTQSIISNHLSTAAAAFASWASCIPGFNMSLFRTVPLGSMNSLDAHTHIIGIDRLIVWGLALSDCCITCSSGNGDNTAGNCKTPNVIGTYQIELEGYSPGILKIDVQSGNRVSGRYGQNENSLTNPLEGNFSTGSQCYVLKGSFENTVYKSKGEFTFTFTSDGRSFSGNWSHSDRSRSGPWSGKRR